MSISFDYFVESVYRNIVDYRINTRIFTKPWLLGEDNPQAVRTLVLLKIAETEKEGRERN